LDLGGGIEFCERRHEATVGLIVWNLLDRKTQVTIIVATAMILLVSMQAAYEFVSGSAVSPFKLLTVIAFLIASVSLWLFNKFWRPMWKRFPGLERTVFPDLNGTWIGTLQTSWKDPSTGAVPGPIETTVWIRQDLLTISVQQQTKESPSWSTRMFPYADAASDRYRLWFSYDNRPHANVSSGSPDHEGVCWLEMNLSLDRNKMKGQYYTSRSTSGNLQITRSSKNIEDIAGRENWASGAASHDFRSGGRT
jgi:fumarate reductase subunit D